MNREDFEMYRNMQMGGLGNGCGPTLIYGILLFVLICFASCRTVKQAEAIKENKTEISNDSTDVSSIHVDTALTEHIKQEKEKEKTNTESHTEKKDSFVTVVDQNGNVVGTKEYHWLKETLREVSERERILKDSLSMYRHISDSLNYYKEKLDSVSNLSQREKIVEVEKEQSISEKVKTFFANAVIGVILFVLIVIVVRLICKKLRR